jgi:transcriptional regulator with XRE-family HTH domain
MDKGRKGDFSNQSVSRKGRACAQTLNWSIRVSARKLTMIKEHMGEMTQAELARKAQLTEAYVKHPSLEVLKHLARALGVPVRELQE